MTEFQESYLRVLWLHVERLFCLREVHSCILAGNHVTNARSTEARAHTCRQQAPHGPGSPASPAAIRR